MRFKLNKFFTIYCEKLINVFFNPDIILTKITNLKIASAPGNDSITVNQLKVLKDIVCVPLSKIFTKSFQESKVPLSWREANVTPIFKKGDKSDPANYRPISLTSICGKLMESEIKDQIMHHLVRQNPLNSSQHGFLANKSCLTNLNLWNLSRIHMMMAAHSI